MAEKRYYWLKLHKDFFKRHEIRIIEDMPNGKDYILFYLKLLVESVTHEGSLRFSDTIPYNEQMLATITNTNVDVVKTAMKIFVELNMIEILDDQTVFMTDVAEMIGSETDWAVKKRLQRKNNVPLKTCRRLNQEMLRLPNGNTVFVDEKRYGGNGMLAYDLAGAKCEMCGSEENLCIHHNNGYSNDIEDLFILCRKCHSKVEHDKGVEIVHHYVHQSIENRDKRIDIRDKSIDKEGESVYGRFENVTLSPEEYKDVCDKGYTDLIEEMSEAIESGRFKTDNCYASLLSWGRRRDAYKKDNGKLKSKPSFDINDIAKKAKLNEEYDI